MKIGSRIQEARKHAGLTQKGLAEMIGVAPITLQQYERNKRQPKLGQLQKIATATQVDIGYLLQIDHDDKLDDLISAFPNAPVIETDDKIRFAAISSGEKPDVKDVIRQDAIKKFGELNYQGQSKVHAYICDLHNLPEYRIGDEDA